MSKTISSLRITIQAYEIAKNRAKNECVSMCEWVSKAILEKAILDDLTSENEEV